MDALDCGHYVEHHTVDDCEYYTKLIIETHPKPLQPHNRTKERLAMKLAHKHCDINGSGGYKNIRNELQNYFCRALVSMEKTCAKQLSPTGEL